MRKQIAFLTAGVLVLIAQLASAAQPPVISSATAKSVTAGQPFNYTITATNGPQSFGAIGLPVGLNLNTSTGAIPGSTNQVGQQTVHLSATNPAGTGLADLTI